MSGKKYIVVLLIIFYWSVNCGAQGGFKKRYYLQNSATSQCRDVIEAPDGKLIMIGLTLDTLNNTAFNRLTIIGTNAQGNVLWRKNYGSSKFTYLDSYALPDLTHDNNGFYFICPVLDSANKQYSVLIRFNYAGDTLWQKRYKAQAYDVIIQSVSKSVDGGLILAGFTQNTSTVVPVLLLKTDIYGNELWRKQLLSTNASWPVWRAWGTLQDSGTKKIIVVGMQYIGVEGQSLAMATDSLGSKLWQTSFNNKGGAFTDVIQTRDKNFISGGGENMNSDLGAYTRYKSRLVKFDIQGNLLWSNNYGVVSPYNEVGAFIELPNSDLIMIGDQDTLLNISLSNSPVVNLMVTKTDKDGNLKWRKHVGNNYDHASSEFARSMHSTSGGGFIIAASAFPDIAAPWPYSIIKIDSTGCDTTEAFCQSLATGIPNFNKVTGLSLSVFPNPVTSVLHIDLTAPDNKNYMVKINDVTGREIEQRNIDAQNYNVLNIDAYLPGVYFLSLSIDNRIIETRRFTIIR